jgi:hypothetical protein
LSVIIKVEYNETGWQSVFRNNEVPLDHSLGHHPARPLVWLNNLFGDLFPCNPLDSLISTKQHSQQNGSPMPIVEWAFQPELAAPG